MVLWEITLATAYFLGLRRTYRLALRLQRRIIPPRFPRLRGFLKRRTRNVFDVALSVHRSIQKRDIQLGKSVGNRILRFLDRVKPSANIRGENPGGEMQSGSKAAGTTSSARHASQDSVSKSYNSDKAAKARNLFISKTDAGGHISAVSSLRQGTSTGFGILPQSAFRSFPIAPLPIPRPSVRHMSSLLTVISKLPPSGVSRQVFREDVALWMRS